MAEPTDTLPAPFATRSASDPTIVDRDGQPVLFVVHACTAPAERMRFATAIVAALNERCADVLAPPAFHRRARSGPLSDAAE